MNRRLPAVVYHADWGSDPKKRWLCKSVRDGGRYTAHAPTLVGDHLGLISRIRAEIGETGSAVVGFDFPIGIPVRYAALIGVTEFKPFLLQLGHGDFRDFYRISVRSSDISKHHPFYPFRPGGTKHIHLWSGLGLTCMDDLRRKSDLGYDGRKPACPLFWTLGANQVGRAAIIGWRDVLAHALRDQKGVRLWPFDGSLESLLKPGHVVIVETYPAECYRWVIQDGMKGSKRKLEVRKKASSALVGWAGKANVNLDPKLKHAIEMGFPDGGDDAFDAAVGLFGILEVLLKRGSGEPNDESVRKLEGWILGQKMSI